MVSDHIVALHLRAKLHVHSKERGKSVRVFNKIYRHLLNAVVLSFKYPMCGSVDTGMWNRKH